MEKCSWLYCYNSSSRRYTLSCGKIPPLVDVYSCGFHITFYCSLCNHNIVNHAINSDVRLKNYQNQITCHFIAHAFKGAVENHFSWLYNELILVDNDYFVSGRGDRGRFCYVSGIVENNPHFICLIPEFSFSDILDQFDEGEVPDWRLLNSILNKPFSCLSCGGRFESFPSNEVFAAHPCNEM